MKREKTYKVKAQRSILHIRNPLEPDDPSKILIYSKCGTIRPTELPDTGALKNALGDRDKAYFECKVDGETLVLLRELRHQRW